MRLHSSTLRRKRLFTLVSLWAFATLSIPSLGRAQSERGAASPQAGDETNYERTFPLGSNGKLYVNNYKGRISVEGWDRDQVVVNVFRIFEGSDDARKWWMAKTDVRFSSGPKRLDVDVQYPDHSWLGWNDGHFFWSDYTGYVQLTIHAPRQVNVELSGYKPEMRVRSVQGDIAIKSYKSPIQIDSTSGGIRIVTYKDTVRLNNVDLRGPLELRMYKGEAWVDIKSLGERADLETGKGEIDVRLPEMAGLNIEIEGGRRSSFHSDFPILTEVNSRYLIRGKINGGGPGVRIRTTKGFVSLRKRAGV